MKTLSIVLTLLLLLPVIGSLLSVYSTYYYIQKVALYSTGSTNKLLLNTIWPAIGYTIFLITSVVLNFLGRYRESSIMCATLLSYYIFVSVLTIGSNILLNVNA